MVLLFRAPVPTASWFWDFALHDRESTMESCVDLATRVSEFLGRKEVFSLDRITISWTLPDEAQSEFQTSLSGLEGLRAQEWNRRIADCWPVGYRDARPATMELVGGGLWIDSNDRFKGDPNLISGLFHIGDDRLRLELNSCHDIWSENDFFGNPHPDIYERNAPRLTDALQAVEDALGVPPTPGEPTFFGTPYNYGIRVHKAEDGSGIDVSDHL